MRGRGGGGGGEEEEEERGAKRQHDRLSKRKCDGQFLRNSKIQLQVYREQ